MPLDVSPRGQHNGVCPRRPVPAAWPGVGLAKPEGLSPTVRILVVLGKEVQGSPRCQTQHTPRGTMQGCRGRKLGPTPNLGMVGQGCFETNNEARRLAGL